MLTYAKYQTPEVCIEAVKQWPAMLEYIKNQTPEICFEALKRDPEVYKYVKLPGSRDKDEEFLRELGLLLLSV